MTRLAIACLGMAVGCFNPDPPRGLRCSLDVGCPDGEICVAGFCSSGAGDAGPPDVPPACDFPAPSALIDPCALGEPGPPLVIDDGDSFYDTDTESLSSSIGEVVVPGVTAEVGNVSVLVLVVENLEIGGVLRVTGSRPLVVVSYSSITIAGMLDVSSRALGPPGAGANAASCQPAGVGGSGGGDGGGGFAGAGGGGGETGGGTGGAGGGAIEPELHGGCPGGGDMDSSQAGSGGGAVYLVAADSILVDGIVAAGGGGGAPGANPMDGGSGGGSGGFIGLDAPLVNTSPQSILAANGGGGGGGGRGSFGGDGEPGDIRALGGLDESNNPSGGDGSAGDLLDGGPANPDASNAVGGGGGGAAGVIRVFGQRELFGIVSPPAF